MLDDLKRIKWFKLVHRVGPWFIVVSVPLQVGSWWWPWLNYPALLVSGGFLVCVVLDMKRITYILRELNERFKDV